MPSITPSQNNNPLIALEQAGYNYSSFTYPLDLATPGAGKDHFMVFHINQTTMKSNYTISNPSGKSFGTSTRADNAKRDAAFNGTKPDSGASAVGNNGKASQGAIESIKQPTSRVATTVVLYMPEAISTGYGASWGREELGVAEDVVNQMAGLGSLKGVLESMGVSAVNNAGALANSLTDLNFSNAASAQTRIAINNHPEVLFNGMNFRSFKFDFKFTPQSEAEAQNVDNIIRAFKFHSAPDVVKNSAGRFWIYPDEFDIQYYSNGKENLFLNKISTCALTDISINYTPLGHWQAFRQHSVIQGAPPVCTEMSLNFIELEIITKRRILSGY